MATKKDRSSNINVPNALTLLRAVAVPVFGWMLLAHAHEGSWRTATTIVFMVAILTDFVDGKIARKYNLVTNFGKIGDSIADKALTGMAFIGLSILGELPWWMTIIILLREWGITVMRMKMLKYEVMAANKGGKLKTAMQSLAITLFCLGLWRTPTFVDVFAWAVMIIAFLLTVVTGLVYIRDAIQIRNRAKNAGVKPVKSRKQNLK
ncbi:CDP-diacylglycerol--glycerol-3-phosphate 3-phosphatidyltransferase [Cutibacterium avidum]|uniref:CDP-diacylglycerol--glycerol-3-phosphate 3-phosphatidyltransferase n=1 Tax=Cutibacterium avidum TaxID=33010 RepID=UPI000763F334|nr:CDP-diacylglycerol--glycerol-3-phosphate 3-phosphatidyltransferase [Cutibacterium avidum]KXA66585.1 CDP-diacylglycerol--glycerol-3-phosphate 3-phosphatidyltransferase [Cutibacterium avidum]MCO6630871.1 CDP-diacylglycerol--glycerol-3-phosphate 3-phosphatidyltransferase [Cutibacterium avidum]MCO6659427.1 CDP-diacylglycerol--glycerol-3-phosphate 3-phosphatidyltransferase [Cutibacterium avidum]MCO6663859.1 CDP-diacylglycerol--glycerol-3-phosphate 3-phosphatidyltransferase [Cutibacterium avidum]